MKIGLIDVDSKIPNLVLMKLSTYHKSKGDEVDFYGGLLDPVDRVYCSKVFDFTPDHQYPLSGIEVIKGGTGYDLTTNLPDEIENCCPDYSLFDCGVYDGKGKWKGDYGLGFTTRGCIRRCPFCLVWRKEGKLRVVDDTYGMWRGQRFLKLLDNNITAAHDHFELICKQLIKEGIYVDFSQGLYIRLIDQAKADLLKKVRHWKRVHFAFDDPSLEPAVRKGVDHLIKAGFHPDKLTFYVLVGFNTSKEEDMFRIDVLNELKVNPFVMPFNKEDPYQNALARWANDAAVRKSTTFENYKFNPDRNKGGR